MRVIGTAGHVDHGKSTLVAALTGTHPDRLKEEQAREMTIDLGFAWLTLPGGEPVGIVDVPGHRDFIENMLAGVGGIDAVLFVIAADEGVMPQTREHLAIIDLLQVESGLIVLTKTDLTPDPDWLELVEADVREAAQGTVLADVPIVRVSARTGEGIETLKHALAALLQETPVRLDHGRPRLPIDRVFTMSGFGTVVTGTLLDGVLRLGDEVEILPSGLRGRVRGLQAHKHKEQTAIPGTRTAVNVSGVEVDLVRRGETLTLPGKYTPTRMIDAYVRLLRDASAPLRHSQEVKFFLGAAEVPARVRLLGVEEIAPGDAGWVQLELREALIAVRGDRYILRRPSPAETIGGGLVIDPQPRGRHRRFAEGLIDRLEALRAGSAGDVLGQSLAALGGIAPLRDVVLRARLSPEQALAAWQELSAEGLVLALESGEITPQADVLVASAAVWQALTGRALEGLGDYHRANPLRRGMPREELKSRLKLSSPRIFSAAVRAWLTEGRIAEVDTLLHLPDFTVRLNAAQQSAVDRLMARFDAAPYAPPSVKEAQAELGEEVWMTLLTRGDVVLVSPEVAFATSAYRAMTDQVREHFTHAETLTVAQLRDRWNTSRRYILAFLEHLDAIGVTARDGDLRRLRPPR